MSLLRDGWLLASGTLTAIRVPAPSVVDRRVAGVAMALAPVAVLPLGVAAAVVVLIGAWLDLPDLVTGYAVVGTLALGTRALHWDGLADTADGLTASYSRQRSLEVMRSGASGPAGVLAVVVVASIQAAAVGALAGHDLAWLSIGLVVCASRSALALACVRGVPAARPDGLGALHVGSVPSWASGVSVGLSGVTTAAATVLLGGTPWAAVVGVLLMVALVLVLLGRCVRRLGGITGDVLGAVVEGSCAVLLVALAGSV